GQMNLVVFEGQVNLCNMAGGCGVGEGGQKRSGRRGGNFLPLKPTQATLDEMTTAGDTTNNLEKTRVVKGGHAISKPWGITLGLIAVGVAVAVPVAASVNTKNVVSPPVKPPTCNPASNPNGCG